MIAIDTELVSSFLVLLWTGPGITGPRGQAATLDCDVKEEPMCLVSDSGNVKCPQIRQLAPTKINMLLIFWS